ncbi:MAG: PAS domain-containing protein, partial [Candidatus Tectomicrobia bacterium]|nr:PAS domain-containing protein [Candidatus Tectomicrobia bacterium]
MLMLEWVTESFSQITGYAFEEVDAAVGWYNLIHPEDIPIALRHRDRLLAGQPDVSEFRIVARNGEVLWLRNYASPIRDSIQDRVVHIYGSAQNIAERKRLEKQLGSRDRELLTLHRISEIALGAPSLEAAFQQIVEEISAATGFPIIAIELYDEAQHKVSFQKITGVPGPSLGEELALALEDAPSGTIARSDLPRVEPEAWERPAYAGELLRRLDLQTSISIPMIVHQRVIGALSLAHPEAVQLDDHFPQWAAILANFVASLTEWKRAEEALLQEKQRLDDVTTYANCGLFLLDEQARVIYANRLAQEWFEAFQPLSGKLCYEIFQLKNPAKECVAFQVLGTGKTVRSDTFVRLSPGENGEKRYFYV